MEYTPEQLAWIDEELAKLNVTEYRFLLESNKYACDKEGNIFSLYMSNKYGIILRVKKLNPHINNNGYFVLSIMTENKYKRLSAHRAIATAWYGSHPELVVNHKNGIKTDNRLENLEFCTQAENIHHAIFNKRKNINNEYGVFIYILREKYGVTKTSLSKIFKSSLSFIDSQFNKTKGILKYIDLTEEQITKIINELWKMEDDKINKELLKKYLKDQL